MIPPQIIVTGSPRHLACPEIKASLQALQERNSGWAIKLFTDEAQVEFIRRHYPSGILDLYQRINPRYGAARADLFRYLAIYVMGGVYLDIKSTCSTPFAAVLRSDDSLVLSQWDNRIGRPYEGWGMSPDLWDVTGGEYVNWFFAAEPKNPIIQDAIKFVLRQISNYRSTEKGLGRHAILRVTGPVAWSRAITLSYRQHKQQLSYRFRIVDSAEAGLVYSIFDAPGQDQGLMRHRSMFQGHYSQIGEPVVITSPVKGV